MRKMSLVLICLLATASASAATNFHGDDFNNMIKDSQKAESELRNQLQKEAGIRFDDKPGTISREKYLPSNEAEQIVVSTTEPKSNPRKRSYNKLDDVTASKRLSQEFREAN